MPKPKVLVDTALVTALNDLLQLDHDAVQAYALAMKQLESTTRKQTLRRYQGDHRRHISELTKLVRAYGGKPIRMPHLQTAPFKLAMQSVGAAGGDRAVLLAFKTNERQVRDKYLRAANRKSNPRDVAAVLRRAASDEARHYTWAEKQLERLGAGGRTAAGKAATAAEVGNARMADAMEATGLPAMGLAEGARRAMKAAARRPGRTAAVVAAGAATAAAAAVGANRLRKK